MTRSSGGWGQPGPRKFTQGTTKGELLRPLYAALIAIIAMIAVLNVAAFGVFLWDLEHGRDSKQVAWVMDHPLSYVALTFGFPICYNLMGLVWKMRQETQDGEYDDANMTRPRVFPLKWFGRALYGFFELKAMWQESQANKQDPDDGLPGLEDFGGEGV